MQYRTLFFGLLVIINVCWMVALIWKVNQLDEFSSYATSFVNNNVKTQHQFRLLFDNNLTYVFPQSTIPTSAALKIFNDTVNDQLAATIKSTTVSLIKTNQTFQLPPLNAVFYGTWYENKHHRTPFALIRLALTKIVHSRLLEYPMFHCEENALRHFSGLDVRIKPPIFIYEGYFHSLVTSNNVFSRNPNPLIGIDFMKPAAGVLLRAFYESFRRANAHVFKALQDRLNASATLRSSSFPEQQRGIPHPLDFDACYQLALWIQRGYLFGDLSIQIHYGMGNYKTFAQAWHADAENSLLHLAMTVRGSRILHYRRGRTDTDEIAEEVIDAQIPGNVYLSSSALVMHAPQFFNTSYSERIIAIHARILYTTEELQLFRRAKNANAESWSALTHILSDVLANCHLQLPTLQDIESVQRELVTTISY